MRYSFNDDTINKKIGLPETSELIRSSNGIEFYSGDIPYVDLGIKDTPYYNSDEYAYPYNGVTIASNKMFYDVGEDIIIHLEKMQGHEEDWVGIVPAGESIEWENQIAWEWTGGFVNGNVLLNDDLPAGDYEAGAFFENSSTELEAKVSFSVRN